MFLNHYHCDCCGTDWTDEYPCQVDDDCPKCGDRHISPHRFEDMAHAPYIRTMGELVAALNRGMGEPWNHIPGDVLSDLLETRLHGVTNGGISRYFETKDDATDYATTLPGDAVASLFSGTPQRLFLDD
ncbi:hypothetical protein [Komagataeibacter europaeus]|uniref:hypothetical protein n=1 Tax=Komagataeibacter europaeus TaxID=33995 RepID=UPI00036C1DC8|nr:hypothetical protein [Komagataeibacter europaeus]GBQ45235.1 hypothetical protein AA18890_2387 [Komagataeibacter europaeus LMG 18890]